MAASYWKSSWRIAAAMLPAVCLMVATANAQNSPTSPTVNPPTTNPPTTAPTTPPPATPPAVTAQKPILPNEPATLAADREIAQMLIIDNNGEVAMAKLAESKVENPSVRAFAQRMVKDHLQFAQSLRLMASTMNPPAATAITTTPVPAGPTLDLEPRATQPIEPGPTTQGPAPRAARPSPERLRRRQRREPLARRRVRPWEAFPRRAASRIQPRLERPAVCPFPVRPRRRRRELLPLQRPLWPSPHEHRFKPSRSIRIADLIFCKSGDRSAINA